MGLQVWLPLNGDLYNQGLINLTPILNNGTWDNLGKIGKCYNAGGSGYISLNSSITLNGEFSICLWIKVNSFNASWSRIFGFYKNTNEYCGLCYSNTNTVGFHVYDDINGVKTKVYDSYRLTPTLGEWIHLTITFDGINTIKWYQNGVLTNTESIVAGYDINDVYTSCSLGADGTGYSKANCCINDFRIYDHCLSPREVKEISKGLVLHYPLSNSGGGCENLMKSSNFSITSGSNTSTVKIATLIPVGTTITVSVQVDADDVVWDSSSNYRRVGIEFQVPKSGTTGNQYFGTWAGQELSSSGNVVEAFTGSFHGRISKTFTTLGEVPALRYVGLYIQGVTSGTVRVSNPKVEIGSVATPWIPNAADTEYAAMGFNDGIEYDVSGYGYNGTKTGAFAYDADTPRYNTSTRFNQTDTRITPPIIFQSGAKIPEISFSFWMKRNDYTDAKNHYIYNDICQIYTYSDYLLRISWKHDTESSSTGNISASSTAITTPNEWHHICYTFDKGILRLYIDGEFKYGSDRTDTGQFMGVYNYGSIGYASGSNISYGGCLSDFRIYATALTFDQIKDLYHTPISLANNGTLLTQGEYVES